MRCNRLPPRPPCAFEMASCRPPTVHSPRPRSNSAATTSSTPRISTTRFKSHRRSLPRDWIRSRSGRSRYTTRQMPSDDARDRIEAIYRSESRRVLATLIRLLGDFDLAEEAVQDAFVAAVERWPVEGVPANAGGWPWSAGGVEA